MSKNYAKISYNNCNSLEYDYTICPWDLVGDNLFNAKEDMEGFDRKEFDESSSAYPSVTIDPVFMTEEEYEQWFIDNVEAGA